MTVVGLLPGTGVPAVWNVRMEYEKTTTATTTRTLPSRAVSRRGRNGSGQPNSSNNPATIAAPYTSGGRITPRFATAWVASKPLWSGAMVSMVSTHFLVNEGWTVRSTPGPPQRSLRDLSEHADNGGL